MIDFLNWQPIPDFLRMIHYLLLAVILWAGRLS